MYRKELRLNERALPIDPYECKVPALHIFINRTGITRYYRMYKHKVHNNVCDIRKEKDNDISL